ncbi:unnamed protein product [Schistosoma rodhaini]|nr:unnamed protein product [Schistosoma rodhaini]
MWDDERVDDYSTLKSSDTFSSSSTSAESKSNTTTEVSSTTITTESVYIGRVFTQFNVKGVLYKSNNAGIIPWSDDYTNYQSKIYISLAAVFCNLIISSLLTANTAIFQGAKCTTVIFIRVTIVIRGKRQVVNSVINNTSTDGVQGSATIELQTLPGSQLSQEHFSQLLADGYNQVNKTSDALLNNLESTRISPVITCSNTQLVCGQHASCRNTDNGVTCTCDPMWKDVNPTDPGKNCTLHPGTIALIVFAGILLILAIIAIIFFIIKTNEVKKMRLRTSTQSTE